MKYVITLLLLFTSCINLDIEPEVSCEDYNSYINALYDEKLRILFNSHPGKNDFKGEIKEIERERWEMLRDCENN